MTPLWPSWAHEGKYLTLFFLILSRCSTNCGMDGWMDECFKGKKEICKVLNLFLFFKCAQSKVTPTVAQSTSQDALGETSLRCKRLQVLSFSGWLYLYIYKCILCAYWYFVCDSFLHSRAWIRRNLAQYLWHHDRKWHHEREKSDEAELHPVEVITSVSTDHFSSSIKKSPGVV